MINQVALNKAIEAARKAAEAGAGPHEQFAEAIQRYGQELPKATELTNEDVDRITKKLHIAGLIHSCITCANFKEKDGEVKPEQKPNDYPAETCLLYRQRPPARVIAYGCPSWVEDLPF